jgi:branched-chain amino acid transport system substrate-binding protein
VLEKFVYFFKRDNVKLCIFLNVVVNHAVYPRKRFKMMRKSRVYLMLVFTLVFLIGLSDLLFASDARGVSGNQVIIGLIADQTGPAAQLMMPYAAGARAYFRHINDTGGVNDRKIKLLVEDDRYSIPMAVAAFKKLVFKDKVLAILGCGGTGQNTALFSQIEKNKVPVISLSWSWTMTDPVQRYVFTATNDNKDEIKVMMEYIVKIMKAKDARIALVGPDVEYAKSGYRVLEEKAKEYNVVLVGREILAMDALDATTQVLTLKKQNVTHVITITIDGPTLALLKSAKRLNYWPIFFDSIHAIGNRVIEAGGETAKNLYATSPIASWFNDTVGISELKKIALKYDPKMAPAESYFIKAWITSKIAHEAIKRAGKNLTPDSFVDTLETIKNLDMKGLTGPVSYSPTNHKGNSYSRMDKADFKKGYFVPVTDWIEAK